MVLISRGTSTAFALSIKLLRPRVVDASSGVERAPGIKDPRLLNAFFGAVAGADFSGGASA